jgi:phosphoglycerate dehydrogenase-like enzyme
LDVCVPEPLPPDSPLWEAPKCYITPHNSSQNISYMARGMAILVENLQKPLDAKFINEVNTARGY